MDAGAVFLPTQVMTSVRFLSIDIGDGAACGITTNGDAYCWGDNMHGQLGVGSAGSRGGLAGSNSPLAVQGGEKFIRVATDGLHACALRDTGTVFCWGVDFHYFSYIRQFGGVTTIGAGEFYTGIYYNAIPTVMQDVNGVPWASSTGSPWTSINIGFGQTCASTQTGALECWGQETTGYTPGYDDYFWNPVSISTDRVFAGFASGGRHDCFIRSDGIAFCSGRNNWGQLGHAPAPLPHEL
jgi:alpha-tubulin suppressor-like RCC1 family protein